MVHRQELKNHKLEPEFGVFRSKSHMIIDAETS